MELNGEGEERKDKITSISVHPNLLDTKCNDHEHNKVITSRK